MDPIKLQDILFDMRDELTDKLAECELQNAEDNLRMRDLSLDVKHRSDEIYKIEAQLKAIDNLMEII